MPDVNRSRIKVTLKDAAGRHIKDRVVFKLYNQRMDTLNQRFDVDMPGRTVILSNVPAVPHGLTELFIRPTRYRYKSVFLNVPAGGDAVVNETLMVDPDEVEPSFPTFSEIRAEQRWADLRRLLKDSGITTAGAWNAIEDLPKAGLLNLHAKLQFEKLDDGQPILGFVDRVERTEDIRQDRVFALVRSELIDRVRLFPRFRGVSGSLHMFTPPFVSVTPDGSFKTRDEAGNLQITFARDGAVRMLADIDIDDHSGLQHAADVLRHKIANKDTHPYDIHDILMIFQGCDPGYTLA
jgi:hypothetical protein